jgi:ferredoxin-type protein NapH
VRADVSAPTAATRFEATRAPGRAGRLQRLRRHTQALFFVLFVTAPPFDVFRFDLMQGHAILFGHDWRLGLERLASGELAATQFALVLLARLFLPLLGAALLFLAVAWRWGRVYCGWLCPHFSVVETLNRLMSLASGRPSLWERTPPPQRHPDGSALRTDRRWWLLTLPLAALFAGLWAVVLLTYLMPPQQVYHDLWRLALSRHETLFVGVASGVLTIEFLCARHLFCRYGCAVGLFQSLAWMSNRNAMVMGFARRRAGECARCYAAGGPGQPACESLCPMRLKPRVPKRAMFTCTQCGQCQAACATVQRGAPGGALLNWVACERARRFEAPVSLTGKRG